MNYRQTRRKPERSPPAAPQNRLSAAPIFRIERRDFRVRSHAVTAKITAPAQKSPPDGESHRPTPKVTSRLRKPRPSHESQCRRSKVTSEAQKSPPRGQSHSAAAEVTGRPQESWKSLQSQCTYGRLTVGGRIREGVLGSIRPPIARLGQQERAVGGYAHLLGSVSQSAATDTLLVARGETRNMCVALSPPCISTTSRQDAARRSCDAPS
jgi:hypothetical protein